MNFAHLHLVLTHFPPVLSLGGAISAAAGVLRRRRDLVQLALLLLIVVGATMPLVYIAGDRAAAACHQFFDFSSWSWQCPRPLPSVGQPTSEERSIIRRSTTMFEGLLQPMHLLLILGI